MRSLSAKSSDNIRAACGHGGGGNGSKGAAYAGGLPCTRGEGTVTRATDEFYVAIDLCVLAANFGGAAEATSTIVCMCDLSIRQYIQVLVTAVGCGQQEWRQ